MEQAGAGFPVVLLHDAGAAIDHLRPLAERLAKRWRTLLVHLPGYGRTPALRPYDMSAAHTCVENALHELRTGEAHFIGHGFGAYRAFAIACRGHVRVRSIYGLSPFADLTVPEAASLQQYAAMLRQGIDPEPILLEVMLGAKARSRDDLVDDVRSWSRAIDATLLADELDAIAKAPDLTTRIATLGSRGASPHSGLPILLRVGTHDTSTPVARARRIATVVKHAVLEEVHEVSHVIAREDLDGTAASLERHLDAVERAN